MKYSPISAFKAAGSKGICETWAHAHKAMPARAGTFGVQRWTLAL